MSLFYLYQNSVEPVDEVTETFKKFSLTATCNVTTLKFKSPDRLDRPESGLRLTCDSCNNVNDLL